MQRDFRASAINRRLQQSLVAAAVFALLCVASGTAYALALLAGLPTSLGIAQLGTTGALPELLNSTPMRSLAIVCVIGMGLLTLAGHLQRARATMMVLSVGIVFCAAAVVGTLFPG